MKKSTKKSKATKTTAKVRAAAEVPEPKTKVEKLPDVFQRTIAIKWSRSRWGNRRKIDSNILKTQAAKDMTRVTKKLLKSDELGRIVTLDANVWSYLANTGLPSSIFYRSGLYLVPIGLVDTVEARMKEFETERAGLVDEFIDAYRGAQQEAKDLLRDLYKATDYPSPEEVRQSFDFGWQWLDLNTPGQLKSINPAIFAEQRAKAEKMVQEAAADCRLVLRLGLKELVDGMVDRLKPQADGKARVLREAFVRDFNEFLQTFSLRNITDDAQLAALVAKAEKIIKGANIADLRDTESEVREKSLAAFTEVKRSLDKVVEVRGRRIILQDAEIDAA